MTRLALLLPLIAATLGLAQDPKQPPKKAEPKPPAKPTGPPPTTADVPYGTHPRQVLDFYQAKSDTPTPVVLAIHGGVELRGVSDLVHRDFD